MGKRQVLTIFGGALLAGWVGGILSSCIQQPMLASADSRSKIVTAQRFVLLDLNGKMRGIWAAEDNGTAGLVMLKPDGRTLAGQFMVGPKGFANFTLFDENGKVYWMADR